MANNENAIVNTTPTTSETPADLVAEKAAPELSPNPAGFGFTKQVQVDSLPDSGAFDTLYLLRIYDPKGHVSDYYRYKWTCDKTAGVAGERTQPHWERVFNPVNNVKHEDGEHATPVHENTAPQAAPEKVFKGKVVFEEDVFYKGRKLPEQDEVGSIVKPNPTLAGTESSLEGLEVDGVKYKVNQPIDVEANPTLAGTEAVLAGLQVGDTKYKVGGGSHCYMVSINTSGQDLNANSISFLYFTENDSITDVTSFIADVSNRGFNGSNKQLYTPGSSLFANPGSTNSFCDVIGMYVFSNASLYLSWRTFSFTLNNGAVVRTVEYRANAYQVTPTFVKKLY